MSAALVLERDAPFDKLLVGRVLDFAAPMIENLLRQPGISGEKLMHMVVMDPSKGPATSRFEDAVLVERSFGASPPWSADYRGFALGKARLAWRLQRDTREVHQQAPYLLRTGDSLLWGSCCRDGLIVAASGAHPWWDEAACGAVVELLKGAVCSRLHDKSD
jgi:hypothetical protein